MGRGLDRIFTRIETWTDPVPEPLLGLAVLALAAVFVMATLRDRHGTHICEHDAADACHGVADQTSTHRP